LLNENIGVRGLKDRNFEVSDCKQCFRSSENFVIIHHTVPHCHCYFMYVETPSEYSFTRLIPVKTQREVTWFHFSHKIM